MKERSNNPPKPDDHSSPTQEGADGGLGFQNTMAGDAEDLLGEDVFAPTLALDAVAAEKHMEASQAGPVVEEEEEPLSMSTIPMNEEQVRATLARLNAASAEQAASAKVKRQTVVENEGEVQQVIQEARKHMELAKTEVEKEYSLPPGYDASRPSGSGRPIAPTLAEQAIPPAAGLASGPAPAPQKAHALPPRAGNTLMPGQAPGAAALKPKPQGAIGLKIAIALVAILILLGVAFVVVVALQ